MAILYPCLEMVVAARPILASMRICEVFHLPLIPRGAPPGWRVPRGAPFGWRVTLPVGHHLDLWCSLSFEFWAWFP